MKPLKQRRQQFVRLVAKVLLDAQLNRPARRASLPHVIHPGGPLAAFRHAELLLKGSPKMFHELFRVTQQQFWQLLEWLELHAGLEDTRFQTSTQKLLAFLWICSFNETQRNTSHRFLVSQSSVSASFHTVLPKIVQLFRAFVKQPGNAYLSADVELQHEKRYDGFSGAVGACDGTLLFAHIAAKDQPKWRSYKGNVSQNVFAAVRFDMAFAYVLAGADGSMQDNRLFGEALERSFYLPAARFYVTDAGYGQRPGIALPFPGARYHLKEWAEGRRRPQTKEELFNLRHARVRNVVERVFGVVKCKWKIVRCSAAEYNIETQIDLVYAICGLWNFLLLRGKEPRPEDGSDNDDGLTAAEMAVLEAARQRNVQRIGTKSAAEIRSQICEVIWPKYEADHQGEDLAIEATAPEILGS